MHSSTVTVAVMSEAVSTRVDVRESDLEWSFCRGSGAGGQHRNKTETAVVLLHRPTQIKVRCESERSQHANKRIALDLLRARLLETATRTASSARAQDRKVQVGAGQRGDKRRTVAVQRGTVVDHLTGRTWRLKDYIRGEW